MDTSGNYSSIILVNTTNYAPYANGSTSSSILYEVEAAEGLPEISVYPSSATTINVELDDSIPFADDTYEASYYMVIKDGGTNIYEGAVEDRVYSLTYDYVTDLTVEISDGYDTVSYEIVAEDMRRTVMTYGKEYYYITSDVVSTSSTSMSGDYIHLMNGYGVIV